MLKPLNATKTKPATMISSDTVLWDGPDIPCINLCKGDSVTRVVYELANLVCKKFEELNPANYNLECINIEVCDTPSFQQLIQILIDKVFCEDNSGGGNGGGNGGGGSNDCCDLIPITVKYAQNELGLTHADMSADFENPTPLTFTEYTVPLTDSGVYELDFTCDVSLTNGRGVEFRIDINGVTYNPSMLNRNVFFRPSFRSDSSSATLTTRLFASNIPLIQNDEIKVTVWRYNAAGVFGGGHAIHRGVFKLTKIS